MKNLIFINILLAHLPFPGLPLGEISSTKPHLTRPIIALFMIFTVLLPQVKNL